MANQVPELPLHLPPTPGESAASHAARQAAWDRVWTHLAESALAELRAQADDQSRDRVA